MDTSDPLITFGRDGTCSHCREFDTAVRPAWRPDDAGGLALEMERIRAAGRGADYDCVVGVSGGVDSSYLLLLAIRHGLRPLPVHVDTGWNSELASHNIESMIRALDLDLYTVVIDWEEMRRLQIAFLRAGVPNQDIPQDHAITASLYFTARRFGIGTLLYGNNYATESVLPRAWGHDNLDTRHILAIHARFGAAPLRRFPLLSFADVCAMRFAHPEPPAVRLFAPLDLARYDKAAALRELTEVAGFKEYDTKHGESRFTRFFQGVLLPRRFGYDKRRAHLSSLVLAGQMGREEALARMAEPALPERVAMEEERFVRKKLALSEAEWREVMDGPRRSHADYPTWHGDLLRAADLARRIRADRDALTAMMAAADTDTGVRGAVTDLATLDLARPLFLYGTGRLGQAVHRRLAALGAADVRGFIDSFRCGTLEGLPVLSLAEFTERQPPDAFVLVCSQFHDVMEAALLGAGITAFARVAIPDLV